MKKLFVPGLLSTIILLAACKKSDTATSTAAIEGTYKFKYISAQTTSSVTGSLGDKAITTSDYTTTNNGGTVVFGNNTLSATALTYSVDTDAEAYLYDGATLLDSIRYPFSFTLPPSNSSGQYKLIGADSIYFPQGSITSAVDGNGSYVSGPSGGRYKMNGNLLTLTQNAAKDSTFDDSGETYHSLELASSTIVLEKQ